MRGADAGNAGLEIGVEYCNLCARWGSLFRCGLSSAMVRLLVSGFIERVTSVAA